MAYEVGQKERTRNRLLDEAAAALRIDGPQRVSVAALMARAGLTHGGFYAHFSSKDDLITQAIDRMFEDTGDWFRRLTEGKAPRDAIAAYVDFYMSQDHTDDVGRGCPLPAISGDVARLSEEARRHFAAGVHRLGTNFGLLFEAAGISSPDARTLAGSVLAEMAGATAMARGIGAEEGSESIRVGTIEAVRRRIEAALTHLA